jgi:hypothetical protein
VDNSAQQSMDAGVCGNAAVHRRGCRRRPGICSSVLLPQGKPPHGMLSTHNDLAVPFLIIPACINLAGQSPGRRIPGTGCALRVVAVFVGTVLGAAVSPQLHVAAPAAEMAVAQVGIPLLFIRAPLHTD